MNRTPSHIGTLKGQLSFDLIPGLERKGTGSYYTPPELVEELLKSALLPVLEDRLRQVGTPKEREKRLLEMSICDPACGSGHFLLAAARRLARELAKIRSGEDEPSPAQYRIALRDVIAHCIYGVDKNPLAVELCKVALWLESYTESKPLNFLDHRIQLGNSLVGIRDLAALKNGVPEEAYKPVTGDDKDVAKDAKAANKRQLRLKLKMMIFAADLELGELGKARQELNAIPDDTPAQVRRKRALLDQFRSSIKYEKDRDAANLWTLAFFARLADDTVQHGIPLTDHVREALDGRNPDPQLVAEATAEADRLYFFHWPLEFPEVFNRGGFDVLLCNPPWEMLQLEEQQFFASRSLAIAHAPNAAGRNTLIQDLPNSNLALWKEYQAAMHDMDCIRKFVRASDLYPLTSSGRNNSYSLFAERLTTLISRTGRIGAVLPTGIATDDTNKTFFAHVATTGRLASLFDFENREGLFPAVDSRMRFALVTIVGAANATTESAQFAFFLTRAEQLQDMQRVFPLTVDDFTRLNPNTKTCPIFRTRADAELTAKIYGAAPILIHDEAANNPWGAAIRRVLNMGDAATQDLAVQFAPGTELDSGSTVVPILEAKLIHQYDSHFGGYDSSGEVQPTMLEDRASPSLTLATKFGIPGLELRRRQSNWHRRWLLVFRDIARATDGRTMIAAVVPNVGTDFTLRVLFSERPAFQIAALLGNLNSLVLDFQLRQFLGGTHVSDFLTKQLAFLPPSEYEDGGWEFACGRVAELVATSWMVQPFLDDIWMEAPDKVKNAILRQWELNHSGKPSGNQSAQHVRLGQRGDSFPYAPFGWEEDRRATIQAELDAFFAIRYGLTEQELRYILDPADIYGPNFPGETFRVLKDKEVSRFGEYRTKRLVLDAWSRLQRGELS